MVQQKAKCCGNSKTLLMFDWYFVVTCCFCSFSDDIKPWTNQRCLLDLPEVFVSVSSRKCRIRHPTDVLPALKSWWFHRSLRANHCYRDTGELLLDWRSTLTIGALLSVERETLKTNNLDFLVFPQDGECVSGWGAERDPCVWTEDHHTRAAGEAAVTMKHTGPHFTGDFNHQSWHVVFLYAKLVWELSFIANKTLRCCICPSFLEVLFVEKEHQFIAVSQLVYRLSLTFRV